MGRPRKSAATDGDGEDHRRKMNNKGRQDSEDARDIGELPPVANPSRKESCRADFGLFCQTYFPATFTLPFSDDHRQVVAKMQRAVIDGGLFAVAMPRGSGKTTLAEAASVYAIVYGFRRFVMLIGASADAAVEMLESIKMELESSEILLADFPESVFPIQELEGEPRRCKGQTYKGVRTHSRWSQDVVVFPTIKGSPASGAIIRVAGITGRVRGQKFKRPDGSSARPDFVIPDDPQTDASANSVSQCKTREKTLAGAILGLAGPSKKIAGVMPCTVIRAGDVSDHILDAKLHPEWNGSRFKLMYSFPTNEDLWNKYREIFVNFNPMVVGDKERAAGEATQFYLENADAMNEGARVAWEYRYEPDEISAIQNAMNLRFRDERAFYAEYQNEPLPEENGDFDELTADMVSSKINRVPRFQVPIAMNCLTMGIDVQGKLLYYVVCAWGSDFTGSIIDYGTWPNQQGRSYFTLSDAKKTLATETGIDGMEGQIYSGLDSLTKSLLSRNWSYGNETFAKIERVLIDSGWGDSTPVVFQFCRQSPFANILVPSKGVGIGPSSKPIGERVKKEGERAGLEWYMPTAKETRGIRSVMYDTNFWKSMVHSRLAVGQGSPGCLDLFGDSRQVHAMIADHLTSEYRVRTEGRGRVVDVWERHANRENHWLDCLGMAAVGASIQGVSLESHNRNAAKPKRKLTLDEMKQRAKAKGGR